jgi:hypothetical protein
LANANLCRGFHWHNLDQPCTIAFRKDIGPQLASTIFNHYPYSGDQSEKLEEANKNGDSRSPITKTPTIKPLVVSLGEAALVAWERR